MIPNPNPNFTDFLDIIILNLKARAVQFMYALRNVWKQPIFKSTQKILLGACEQSNEVKNVLVD